MDSKTFWGLGLYDWTLWVERIIAERERRKLEQEYEWERLSHLLTPIFNYMRDVKEKPEAFKPTDIFLPSYRKGEDEEPKKKISLKDVRANLGSKFKK